LEAKATYLFGLHYFLPVRQGARMEAVGKAFLVAEVVRVALAALVAEVLAVAELEEVGKRSLLFD
jgi:hypothetical protein